MICQKWYQFLLFVLALNRLSPVLSRRGGKFSFKRPQKIRHGIIAAGMADFRHGQAGQPEQLSRVLQPQAVDILLEGDAHGVVEHLTQVSR